LGDEYSNSCDSGALLIPSKHNEKGKTRR